jgi:hypothetical protein
MIILRIIIWSANGVSFVTSDFNRKTLNGSSSRVSTRSVLLMKGLIIPPEF